MAVDVPTLPAPLSRPSFGLASKYSRGIQQVLRRLRRLERGMSADAILTPLKNDTQLNKSRALSRFREFHFGDLKEGAFSCYPAVSYTHI